jgi:hypothetical protein
MPQKKRSAQKSSDFLQNIKAMLGVDEAGASASPSPARSASPSPSPSYYRAPAPTKLAAPKPPQVRLLKSIANMPRNVSPTCTSYESFKFSENELGRGSYGSVSAACAAEECDLDEYNYAAKIVQLQNERQQKEFLIEATITYFAGQQGFGVPVQTFFLCDEGRKGILVMLRMEPVVAIDPDQLPGLFAKFNKMHQNGILHGDLFPRNVLAHPRTKEIFIADFGLSFVLRGPVPNNLRVTDVIGFLLGQPPDLKAGLKPKFLANEAYKEYRRALRDDGALLQGIRMRLNAAAQDVNRPMKGGAPYAIDCIAYYKHIYAALAPSFTKQLGLDGILKKSVWSNFCENEDDVEEVDSMAEHIM